MISFRRIQCSISQSEALDGSYLIITGVFFSFSEVRARVSGAAERASGETGGEHQPEEDESGALA